MKIIDKINAAKTPFFSLEFFPPKNQEEWPAFFATAQKLKALNPLFASVTYGAGGSNQHNTMEISRRLHAETGICPMTHLTCVGASKEKVREFLQDLGKAGVHDILALRGDPPKLNPDGSERSGPYDWSQGQFRHASDLIAFIKQEFPDFGVAAAGYPAPHPESPTMKDDRKFTALKLAAGADFIITQLFFDVREYLQLVDTMKVIGIKRPVIPGILPILSLDSIRHVLAMCGGHIPAKLYLALEEANNKGGAAAVREVGIKYTIEQIRQLLDAGVPGIHLYTLNKAELCLRIAGEVKI